MRPRPARPSGADGLQRPTTASRPDGAAQLPSISRAWTRTGAGKSERPATSTTAAACAAPPARRLALSTRRSSGKGVSFAIGNAARLANAAAIGSSLMARAASSTRRGSESLRNRATSASPRRRKASSTPIRTEGEASADARFNADTSPDPTSPITAAHDAGRDPCRHCGGAFPAAGRRPRCSPSLPSAMAANRMTRGLGSSSRAISPASALASRMSPSAGPPGRGPPLRIPEHRAQQAPGAERFAGGLDPGDLAQAPDRVDPRRRFSFDPATCANAREPASPRVASSNWASCRTRMSGWASNLASASVDRCASPRPASS